MERLYRETDWEELSRRQPSGCIEIQGISVPFVVFENEDDVTTRGGKSLGDRLEKSLALLWRIRSGEN